MKKSLLKKFTITHLFLILGGGLFIALLFIFLVVNHPTQSSIKSTSSTVTSQLSTTISTPLPTPTPKPTPLSFADMSKLYGPCVQLPTLMYHHIQDLGIAKTEGHASLTVDTKYFARDMQYLSDHGYSVLPMTSLISFFDNGTPIPKKSVMITIDDGYDDFGTDAAPILAQYHFPATLFVPTGLVENPGYLHWSTITSIAASQPILMANHTWSHHNMEASLSVIQHEVTTAETQLEQHGLDNPKVFAYPYGLTSPTAINFLNGQGFKLAFTTVYGNILCKQQRLTLPRVRIGNAPLSSYGL
ncbi:hypothetical protein C5B42_02175 [Candidatus Cerribacteria bacterium 'Amazon FNV 2010 28 9']|uniref:NodB homology domain-containing protein n=1 Tax=Candidatus Cerribacteria bacterium 'Amazon FNV 2010 28 9' TaxID=2081795 RepID=A0A317JP67_9BACT|nr:MAG: hypothetical protein C5B42_02175 [Candidatus Cerribacteria bacterium 'Amazon FNV 2010 28 9']